MPDFCHLHCHTQFSLLDGAASIQDMVNKAVADGQQAIAITDHGNMFGAFQFYNKCTKAGIKPIIGCEVYIVNDRFRQSFTKGEKDVRHHQLLLAKDAEGYKNLSKICSIGFIEGLYRTFPRVDMDIIRKHSKGLIATTCCIGARVPQTILFKGEEEGEKVFKEFLDIFGEDYYVELQRHEIQDIDGTGYSQEDLNQILLKWAKKYDVKVIATNDSHYVDKDDWQAHDILLCINTGNYRSTPIGYGQGMRFGFPNDQFWFKTKQEMETIFSDVPFALDNTMEIVSKINTPKLARDILMPNFQIPEAFKTQDDFLRHLSYEGAKKKYGHEWEPFAKERIDHELKIIENMGFPGYFLIVQDFIQAAKDIGVEVGPGRGSAAGSAVAYCTGITNIDPIKYNLLFERFLNPERVSMPDIDIDFDDEGRQKVIDYVVEKYGQNQVAQIITYGTMAAKSSIRDVARVLELPLPDADKIAKLVPEGPKVNLKKAFKEVPELASWRNNENTPYGETLKMAETLEGSVRHRGIHAAGVIIAPDDLMEYIPVCTAKDADLWVTQFDGKVVEDAGMLKMDFLGLKTLTIIKDAITNIHNRFSLEEINEKTPGIIPEGGKRIDPDLVAEQLEDTKTYELFQRGETVGIFQFESGGMQKYLKQLKPTNIEDLIAMNALYRPGPMDYIPSFVNRKHGREQVDYPHEWLEPILKPSYGIMVYQEQIMQTAQIMAGYSLGQADLLRRAMGKKKLEEMQRQRIIFRDGAGAKGVDSDKADEIFDIMEKFAAYGFNRSHSAAYSFVAFQTAYLKAHYPAEYMASVLTHNMNDIKKVNFFLSECNRMKLITTIPDVNESNVKFTVNRKGEIRFALSAIKGVGEAAVQELVTERTKNGNYQSVFDLTKRVNLRSVNKKALECLTQAGAFDSFTNIHRAQYFYIPPGGQLNLLETAVKFGNSYQKSKKTASVSLFGDALMEDIPDPEVTECEPWPLMEQLRKEREMTGIYLSGHPLDQYRSEIDAFCNCNFEELPNRLDEEVRLAAIVMEAVHRTSKTGKPFGKFVLEDFYASWELMLFGEDYIKHKNYLDAGRCLFIKGTMKRPRWKKDGDYELSISDNGVRLLSSVMDEQAKKVSIKVSLEAITDQWIKQLYAVCKKNPGKLGLNIEVIDINNRSKLNFFSKNHQITLTKEVIDVFDKLPGMSYKIHS